MIKVFYKPSFVRQYKKLHGDLQEEVKDKILQFKNPETHIKLKVHKLKGKLQDFYSFSVNYKYRIVFIYEKNQSVSLLSVGDHDIYK